MSDTIPGADDSAELNAANAKADASFKAGNSGSLKPDIDPAAAASLDETFESLKNLPEPGVTEENIGRQNANVKPPVAGEPEPAPEPTPEPEKKPDPKPEPEKKADVKPEPTPEKKKRTGLVDDLLDDHSDKPKEEPADKAYDDIKLRSDASPKTQETFNAVKTRALEREAAVKTQYEAEHAKRVELEAKLTELEKNAGKMTPELEQELKEHREFRALHDVSARPEFKEKFDSKIEKNYGELYEIFKGQDMRPESIEALQRLPDDQRLDWIEKNVVPLLSDTLKRVVQAKLYENVNISQDKQKALAEARANADKVLAEQRELPVKERQKRDAEFAATLRPMLQKLPYVYTKEVPAGATPAEKAAIEQHNATAAELQEVIRQAIIDETPATRAQTVLAVPMARYLSAQVKTLTARAEAAEKQLAAIKAAGSTSRLGKTASPASAPVHTTPRGVDTDGESEVDKLFRETVAAGA